MVPLAVRLEALGPTHRDSYQAMLRTWIAEEGSYPHNDADLALEDFDSFLEDIAAERSGAGLPAGVQRQVTYVGVTGHGEAVGEFRLRPWRQPPYRCGNGHLGYNVAHQHRRRGVATEGLRQLRLSAGRDFALPASCSTSMRTTSLLSRWRLPTRVTCRIAR